MVDLGNIGYRFVVGIVIGQLIDEILRHVGIVLSCKENLESLQAKVKSLQTIITQLEQRELNNGQRNSVYEIIYCRESIYNGQITATKLALKNWVVKLQDLHRDSSEMEQNIPRINVISRYGTGNKIKQKISDLDNHLKLVPVIKLELALWSLMQIPVKTLSDPVNLSEVSKLCLRKLVKVSVIKQILGDIKMVLCFNNEVASLTELVTSIRPIFDEICEMQDRRLRAINEWLTSLSQLLEEADNIKWVPWWNVICRYKKGREITSLISDIEAHVKLASVINLEPLFQVIDGLAREWRGRAAPTTRTNGNLQRSGSSH